MVPHPSDEFFGSLGDPTNAALLASASGTLRFDLSDGSDVEHWYVTLHKGEAEVTRSDGPADVVVTAEQEVFGNVVTGQTNAMAAVLRGELAVVGALGLVVSFQRVFPGPPGSRRA